MFATFTGQAKAVDKGMRKMVDVFCSTSDIKEREKAIDDFHSLVGNQVIHTDYKRDVRYWCYHFNAYFMKIPHERFKVNQAKQWKYL